jgi:hypothetical protein
MSPMARPRIERGIPAQTVKSTGSTPAGADHPPPSRYYLYSQSKYFFLRLGKWIQKMDMVQWVYIQYMMLECPECPHRLKVLL